MCNEHHTHGKASNEEQFHQQIKKLMEETFINRSKQDRDIRIQLVDEKVKKKRWAILITNPEEIYESDSLNEVGELSDTAESQDCMEYNLAESMNSTDLEGEKSEQFDEADGEDTADSSNLGDENNSVSEIEDAGECLDSEGFDRDEFQGETGSIDDELRFEPDEDTESYYEQEMYGDQVFDEESSDYPEESEESQELEEWDELDELEEPEELEETALKVSRKESGNELQDEDESYGSILMERMRSEFDEEDDSPIHRGIESEDEEDSIGVWEPGEVLKELN